MIYVWLLKKKGHNVILYAAEPFKPEIKKNIHLKLYGENVSLNQFLCHIVFLICIIYQNT